MMAVREPNVDLEALFSDETHLHSLCWNLFNLDMHREGLLLIDHLFRTSGLQNRALYMIRPLGRTSTEKYKKAKEHCGKLGAKGRDWECLEIGGTLYYSHCELWIQVPETHEDIVWREIVAWIGNARHGFAGRSMENPIWSPFGNSLNEAGDYPRNRHEIQTKSDPVAIKRLLPLDQIPWLLKLIWSRATGPILEAVISNGVVNLIDPGQQKSLICDLYERILADIKPKLYGLASSSNKISPMGFGVSHMPAFALNAITGTRPFYQIQCLYNEPIAWPYKFSTKEQLLSVLGR